MRKTYIIAEIAWGHMGDLERLKNITREAKDAGANAIGIHITDIETYITKDYGCIAGQTLSDTADNSMSVFDYLKNINISQANWLKFNSYANQLGIEIVAMCNDENSFEFSKKLNIRKYVISAASFYEFELIEKIIKYNNNIIIRMGGATFEEIEQIIDFIFVTDKNSKINMLVGIQLYPTNIDQLHIRSIRTLKEKFDNPNISFGLADHIRGDMTEAIYLPALSLAYGAISIEKHITTDRDEKLEDYEAALGIDQFKNFVSFVRMAEIALGHGSIDYLVNDSYKKYRDVVRKKIVSSKLLKKGEFITKNKISFKRSDFGAHLNKLKNILGKRVNKDIAKNQGISISDVY